MIGRKIDPEHGSASSVSLEFEGFYLCDVALGGNVEVPDHYHEYTCLTLVLEGGFVEIAGSKETEVSIHSALIKAPESRHRDVIYRQGVRAMIIALDPGSSRFAEIDRLLYDQRLCRSRDIASIALEMASEVERRDPLSRLALEGLVMSLIASVGRELAPARNAPSWLARVLDFVNSRPPPARVTLADAASIAGVPPARLSRVFRRHCGTSLSDYIRRVRLEYVAERLRTSSETICEIAQLCGFTDQSHLTHAFRRHYGTTPYRYRKGAAEIIS